MKVVVGVLLLIPVVAMVFGVAMLRRNNAVYNYRSQMIDMLDPSDFNRQLTVFNSISYNEMVWKFWRPLKDFYRGKGIATPD